MPTPSQIQHAETYGNPNVWASDEQSDALLKMEQAEAVAREIEAIGNWTGDVVFLDRQWHVVMDDCGESARRMWLEDWKAEALRRLDEAKAELLKL